MATKELDPKVEAQALEKDITPYVTKAQKLVVIESPKDMEKASEMRTQLKTYAKEVKNRKETVTKPAYAAYKAAMALFAPIEDRIEETLNVINKAMISYQTEQKKLADIEEAKIAARVGEGKGKFKFDTAVRKMDAIEKPADKVATKSGGTQFITVKKFEVEDVSKLPVEYILPDEVKIRASMKAGIELPGVRYFTEEVPRNI